MNRDNHTNGCGDATPIHLDRQTALTTEQAVALIKQQARDLGFVACGITTAGEVDGEAQAHYDQWLAGGYAAGMDYMHRNRSLRVSPNALQPGAQSVIVVAMNYYPAERQTGDARFAYYAYGTDYHYVVKQYLTRLGNYIAEEIAPRLMPDHPFEWRPFTDSAPLLEVYHAVQSGIGFRGRNGLLIVPHYGSYCFIGELLTNLPLPADSPIAVTCGSCRRCIDACPTHALHAADRGMSFVDARRCISYQTIENHTDIIPDEVAHVMGARVYGCDACQEVCPWNNRLSPTTIPELQPEPEFLTLNLAALETMGSGEFRRLFGCSAIRRAGLRGLRRNVSYCRKCRESKQ